MPRDDDINAQVNRDWEFTRRAEQLMNRLRTMGQATPSSREEPEGPPEDGEPPEQK
jgi:hypothetical protein